MPWWQKILDGGYQASRVGLVKGSDAAA